MQLRVVDANWGGMVERALHHQVFDSMDACEKQLLQGLSQLYLRTVRTSGRERI